MPEANTCLVRISTQPSGRYLACYDQNVEALPQFYLIEGVLVKSCIVLSKFGERLVVQGNS